LPRVQLCSKYQHEQQHIHEFSHDAPKAHEWGAASGKPLGRGVATLTTGAGRELPASAGRVLGTAPAPTADPVLGTVSAPAAGRVLGNAPALAARPSVRSGGLVVAGGSGSSSTGGGGGSSSNNNNDSRSTGASARASAELNRERALAAVAARLEERAPSAAIKRSAPAVEQVVAISPGGESGTDARTPKRIKLRAQKSDVVDLSSSTSP
jgi:hypothetical protein